MNAAGSTFPWALCASCVLHGAAILALDGYGRTDAGAAGDAQRHALTVVLGPLPAHRGPAAAPLGTRYAALPLPFGSSQDAVTTRTGEGSGVLAAPAAPAYFPPGALDRVPRPLGELDFASAMPGVLSERGRLVLVVFIDAQGTVENVEVESSDMPEAYAATATDTLRGATFFPGEKNGRPAKSRVRIEISYD